MAIQFPDAPFQGQSFVASNGVSYTYDNGGWIANSQSGLDDRYVNLNGDSMTGDLTVPSLNGGQLAGFRNQIINGDFRIWQRGISFTNQGVAYTADRWLTNLNTASDTAFRATTDIPSIPFAIGLTGGSPDYVDHKVELDNANSNGQFGVGTTWTLSWYSTAPNGSVSGRIRFQSSPNTPRNDWTRVGSIQTLGTVGSFTRYAQQYTVPERVGDCDCISVVVQRDGSTTSWDVTGFQLEPGPVATPFEHRPMGTELALCQRYYFASAGNVYGTAPDRTGIQSAFPVFFPSTMRVKPTMSSSTGKTPAFSDISATGLTLIIDQAQDYYFSVRVYADAEL